MTHEFASPPANALYFVQYRSFCRSFAGSVHVDLGVFGSAAITGASVEFYEEQDARTFTASYMPQTAEGSISARLIYTESDENDLAFAITFTASLNPEVSGSAGFEQDRRGATYRAGVQRAADYDGGLGWRARIAEGERQYAEIGAQHRGRYGDSAVQLARAEGVLGSRFGHGGSIGLIDGRGFAAPAIRGGFALVDVGAPGVSVLRGRFNAGETGADGRVVITGLHPYDGNVIAIDADDLPFDRTPTATETLVTPGDGAGVVVRFTRETEQLVETEARFANGEPAPRGAVLVRLRDGARFPVGASGRVVLRGARDGDVVRLDLDQRCIATADAGAAEDGLILQCGAA